MGNAEALPPTDCPAEFDHYHHQQPRFPSPPKASVADPSVNFGSDWRRLHATIQCLLLNDAALDAECQKLMPLIKPANVIVTPKRHLKASSGKSRRGDVPDSEDEFDIDEDDDEEEDDDIDAVQAFREDRRSPEQPHTGSSGVHPDGRVLPGGLRAVTQHIIDKTGCRHPVTLKRVSTVFAGFAYRNDGLTQAEFRGYVASVLTQVLRELEYRSAAAGIRLEEDPQLTAVQQQPNHAQQCDNSGLTSAQATCGGRSTPPLPPPNGQPGAMLQVPGEVLRGSGHMTPPSAPVCSSLASLDLTDRVEERRGCMPPPPPSQHVEPKLQQGTKIGISELQALTEELDALSSSLGGVQGPLLDADVLFTKADEHNLNQEEGGKAVGSGNCKDTGSSISIGGLPCLQVSSPQEIRNDQAVEQPEAAADTDIKGISALRQELDSLLSSLPNAAMLSNGSSHDMGHREWQDDPAILSKEDGSEQPVH